MDATARAKFARRLLRLFDRTKRAMPWRHSRDPYAIWLSESMLQQTTVATVIPYYERFLERFPTVDRLAAAPLDDVLRLWAGLGYYARARHLHAAAQRVVAEFGGRLPDTVDALRSLPGIGRYTAGAVASIAFGRRAAVVDGNVRRVLARVFALRGDLSDAGGQERLWSLAESLLPERRCGDFNQALMELGATTCTPSAPGCTRCPVRELCRAASLGTPERYPRAARKATVRSETHAVAAIMADGRWLFVRRPLHGLWAGLWELPSAAVNGGTPLKEAGAIATRLRVRVSFEPEPFCRVLHVLSHRRLTMIGYVGHVPRPVRRSAWRWLSLDDLGGIGVSQAMQRVVAALRRHETTPLRRHRPGAAC